MNWFQRWRFKLNLWVAAHHLKGTGVTLMAEKDLTRIINAIGINAEYIQKNHHLRRHKVGKLVGESLKRQMAVVMSALAEYIAAAPVKEKEKKEAI